VFSCAHLRLLEADEGIARDRLVARALGTQLSIHNRFALQLIAKVLHLLT
jgi:hypothetical protein